ncbi:transcription initiation factor IIA subunit 1 isoform X2 [Frankliniella occidentalis]|uniref:Transcription initiation factor IIA subunit 1 isoform X2 n=1 Tax=Frankliniella occidentalis TaxID=133901 RepID=A0A9C6UCG9_FRAOC|nr:transcription initiation factor IIA subunit 1 isoform X2 [Frankliniella occidentalis]
MALSQTGVLKLYNSVIEDVITGVREAFLDEGVDDQVLQELKQLWEMKLNANKAVEVPEPLDPAPPLLGQKSNSKSGGSKKSQAAAAKAAAAAAAAAVVPTAAAENAADVKVPISAPVQSVGMNASNGATLMQGSGTMPLGQGLAQSGVSQTITTAQQQLVRLQQPTLQSTQSQVPLMKSQPVQQPTTQTTQQTTPQAPAPAFALASDPNRQVPIQITLPPQAGVPDAQPRVLTIHVPASALTGNQLQQVLTGPVISATMNLPLALACSLLQQHVNAALQGQAANAAQLQSSNNQNNGVTTFGHQNQTANTISQLDGALDTSEEEDDDDDDDDDFDEDDDIDEHEDDENNENEGGAEEEPLNSEDDVSDDDPQDLFDTENVVVCQYDKITRTRNKWKFYLKDGIMNLNGKDFVFQRATGDAEW